jgi:hypothetical protein
LQNIHRSALFFYARRYYGVLYLPSSRSTKSASTTTVLCGFLYVELFSHPQPTTKLRYLKSAARGSKVGIVVGTVTSTIRSLIPGGFYIFMSSERLWGSPTLYSKGNGTLPSEGYADHSSLSTAAVKREWSNTSTSPYAFTAWTGATLPFTICSSPTHCGRTNFRSGSNNSVRQTER